MATRLFDTDGFQRTKKLWHEDYDGNVVLETIYDAGPAIEMAKARMNEHRGRKSRWRDDEIGSMVASIPMVLYMQLHKEGIAQNEERLRAWINDSDNSAFRTRPGKI